MAIKITQEQPRQNGRLSSLFKNLQFSEHRSHDTDNIEFYYTDKGIVMGTKTLVILIRHYIRDLSGVFSVCHAKLGVT